MNKLQKYSTSELIGELRKRKEVQLFDGGLYANTELRGKYGHENIKLPNNYWILLISDFSPLNNS
ncbi:hypothetical protein [Lentilactobacillus kefiri]|uniref:hypothetical protein n=1 Tax=Lentilactobacillus kefiri TaxID=33962 RepID=UPI00246872D6|nr:hypothetical protein [Lentilactobacillus kefiri]MDH5107710.1 hypothetical protein [Lentilactobacillus kefiri]